MKCIYAGEPSCSKRIYKSFTVCPLNNSIEMTSFVGVTQKMGNTECYWQIDLL